MIRIAIALIFIASVAQADDMRCLALNIYYEARSESEEGQIAVAHTTLNRVASNKFPDSVCEVIWQPKQFSWTHDGKSDTPKNKRAWDKAKDIAKIAMDWYNAGEDFSAGALYYHADYVKPYWASYFKRTVTVDKHIFYK